MTRAPIRTAHRALAIAAVCIPFAGSALAVWMLWGGVVGPIEISLLVVMYVATVIGIETGFHRHFSHAAFSAPSAVRVALAIAGSMASEGPVISWVAIHRRHHKFSDQPGDPHSPHLHGTGITSILRGLFHAHVGWLFRPEETDWRQYVPDLLRDRSIFNANARYGYWVLLGLAIPTVAGGVLHRSWRGAALGLLWGGLVRVFLVHHATWSVNSICHWVGSRPFTTRDRSTNNVWLALISMGGSWHHNHHAFPNSARTGFRWWQMDLSWWLIRALAGVGLASNLRCAAPERLGMVVVTASQVTGTERINR
jgi:stearoyl-CoA desaturase (delta-9 desaturase)